MLLESWIADVGRAKVDLVALHLSEREDLRVVGLALRSLDSSQILGHVVPLHYLRFEIGLGIILVLWLRLQVPRLALVGSAVCIYNRVRVLAVTARNVDGHVQSTDRFLLVFQDQLAGLALLFVGYALLFDALVVEEIVDQVRF